jgi:hypothetical protein
MMNARRFLAIGGMIGLGLLLPSNVVFADSQSFLQLTAEWQQWALSIPTPVNPMLDVTGENCTVGQHGSMWFLAGVFGGGPAVTRTCLVPENTELFFPVINSVNFNTPNVCGQGPEALSVKALRGLSADFIDGAADLSVVVDGDPVRGRRSRVKSVVFGVALPENNVFDAPCTAFGLGNVPAGVYSPAVDDGVYVQLEPLTVGEHTLQIHAENPSVGFSLDVTYSLTVVPVAHR